MFSPQQRRSRRPVAWLAIVLLFVVGCSSAGLPTSYDDQPDTDGVSLVETNWNDGCEVAFSEDLAGNANDVCKCSYARIRTQIPFDEFVEINDRLKDDPLALQANADDPETTDGRIVQIVAGCIAGEG